MKKVVSVSLGSRKGDFRAETVFAGETFEISRIGTAGDLQEYARLLTELDGTVDAIGLGGIDLYLVAGGRKYAFRDARKLASLVKTTPVVDGSGLKNTLERETLRWCQSEGIIDFRASKTLVVCAVDRFGMAEEVAAMGGPVRYGDLMFNLGIPFWVKSFSVVKALARIMLPVVVQMPFKWLYPTGEKQDQATPKFGWAYQWADIIAGDRHLIHRYLPQGAGSLEGKAIITNTTTQASREELKARGARLLVTTTPSFQGRSPGTNVLEGVLVACTGRRPEELTVSDYNTMLQELGWKPEVVYF